MARLTNSCLQLAHSAIATGPVRAQRTAASNFVRDAVLPPCTMATWLKMFDVSQRWSRATREVCPTWDVETIQPRELVRCMNCFTEMCRSCASRQLVHQRSCHHSVTLGDHVQRVTPTRPTRWNGRPTCAPQSHPSKSQRKGDRVTNTVAQCWWHPQHC